MPSSAAQAAGTSAKRGDPGALLPKRQALPSPANDNAPSYLSACSSPAAMVKQSDMLLSCSAPVARSSSPFGRPSLISTSWPSLQQMPIQGQGNEHTAGGNVGPAGAPCPRAQRGTFSAL
jgi:hypothetical protein